MSCGVATSRKYDLYNHEFRATTHETNARMREQTPVHLQPGLDDETPIWFVTRYDDVVAVFLDNERFVLDAALNLTPEEFRNWRRRGSVNRGTRVFRVPGGSISSSTAPGTSDSAASVTRVRPRASGRRPRARQPSFQSHSLRHSAHSRSRRSLSPDRRAKALRPRLPSYRRASPHRP